MSKRFTRCELVRELEGRHSQFAELYKNAATKEDKRVILAYMDELSDVLFLIQYWEKLHL